MDDLTHLLLAARDGDRLALGAAIRTSQREVWRLAARVVGRDEADDVTQDTFLRAFRSLPTFRAESSGMTWLLAIARHACVDALRRRGRARRLSSRLAAVTRPSELVAPDESGVTDLESLLASLSDDQRLAFVLTQVLGRPYREAAEICGVPIGTIRSRVARAREQLLTRLRSEAG